MLDPDLIDRAVKAGLAFGPCEFCQGERRDSDGATCRFCRGTGQHEAYDRALMVVSMEVVRRDWTLRVQPQWLLIGTGKRDGGHRETHDGTSKSIATAALTAFCRAREAADVNP